MPAPRPHLRLPPFAGRGLLLRRSLAAGLVLLLAGCSADRGSWPTLAPRPGEISPLVPRTPLGGCAGCGQDVFPAEAQAPPPAPPRAAPADAAERLGAIEAAVTTIESDIAGLKPVADKAAAAAAASPADEDLGAKAEVARSRLLLLYVPLIEQGQRLDALDDALADTDGAAALQARIESLRARIDQLRSAQPEG